MYNYFGFGGILAGEVIKDIFQCTKLPKGACLEYSLDILKTDSSIENIDYVNTNTTTVVHCKKEKYDVYCGRPGPYGNPFTIGKDGNREEVCEKFRKFWYAQEQEKLREQAKQELTGKILGCWCKPKQCHCDIIAEFLNEI